MPNYSVTANRITTPVGVGENTVEWLVNSVKQPLVELNGSVSANNGDTVKIVCSNTAIGTSQSIFIIPTPVFTVTANHSTQRFTFDFSDTIAPNSLGTDNVSFIVGAFDVDTETLLGKTTILVPKNEISTRTSVVIDFQEFSYDGTIPITLKLYIKETYTNNGNISNIGSFAVEQSVASQTGSIEVLVTTAQGDTY